MKYVGHDEGASFRTSCMRNPSGRFRDEDGCPMKDVGHDEGASFRTSCMRNPSGRFQDEDGCPMKDVGHDGGRGCGHMTAGAGGDGGERE